MTTLLIKNVTLKGQEGLQQILIEDGQFKRIESNDVELNHNGDTIDAEGGMAVAPFCEPHIHLDTTQTAGEQAGTSLAHCLRVLNVGLSAKKCCRLKT